MSAPRGACLDPPRSALPTRDDASHLCPRRECPESQRVGGQAPEPGPPGKPRNAALGPPNSSVQWAVGFTDADFDDDAGRTQMRFELSLNVSSASASIT